MRVFVAGGTGVLGRRLVSRLVAGGHQVTATTKSTDGLALVRRLGADATVMDGLDPVSVGEAVARAQPDAVVHQMTALSGTHPRTPTLRGMGPWSTTTNRLRTEGTEHLLAAAQATGVDNVVVQSYAGWNGLRQGGWIKTEQDPLDPMTGTAASAGMAAIRHLETTVIQSGGAVLRYGEFYGPGTLDNHLELLRRRQFPLIAGGTGYNSWVHVDDAAGATVLALEQRARGVFNIVDDEPAPASEWLVHLATCAGTRQPTWLPAWLARVLTGQVTVMMMVDGRGFSNAKAKRELGWQLQHPSWRQGFKEELA